ncbi:MAG: threonine/serine exporter family protein [bacterium]
MQKIVDQGLIQEKNNETPLPEIAHLVLTVGRLLLEWGANARTVHEAISNTARGLGCDSADAFCQHAAIITVIRRGSESHTQMGKVGEHIVNLRRTQNLQQIIQRVSHGELTCAQAQEEVEKVALRTKHYPIWFICLATGLACSSFGRLFKSDWVSFLPTLIGAGVGQYVRHTLFHKKYNIFLTAGTVSFVAATLAGFGAKALGSVHLPLAMVAAVLLLVPGIPVLNAQIDVIEGKPNLAAARALRITFLLLFMALGLSVAQGIVFWKSPAVMVPNPPDLELWVRILHQAFFGGVAAAGFGVLFNTPPRILGLCFASGAFALAIRTFCQSFDLGLPLSSFIAALSLATVDRAWHQSQTLLGSVIAVVGCIAMVPGSMAAKGLMGLFALIHAKPEDTVLLTGTMENLIIVTFTLVAIGIGLIIPTLVYPQKVEH